MNFILIKTVNNKCSGNRIKIIDIVSKFRKFRLHLHYKYNSAPGVLCIEITPLSVGTPNDKISQRGEAPASPYPPERLVHSHPPPEPNGDIMIQPLPGKGWLLICLN